VLKQETISEQAAEHFSAELSWVSEERVIRLQCIIAGLLAKNELLRRTIATNFDLTNQADSINHQRSRLENPLANREK
jgi:hypothetical protein